MSRHVSVLFVTFVAVPRPWPGLVNASIWRAIGANCFVHASAILRNRSKSPVRSRHRSILPSLAAHVREKNREMRGVLLPARRPLGRDYVFE